MRHGAKEKLCSNEGCTNQARKGGVCSRHGAKRKLCSHEGCTNIVQKGGVCTKHGAKRTFCSNEGCTKYAQRGGVCCRHGARLLKCSREGCTNNAQKGGLCKRHGGVTRKTCSHEECTNRAILGGLCITHGDNMAFKMTRLLRTRLSTLLRAKNTHIQGKNKLIGCTPSQLVKYIEKQFVGEMSWKNHGGCGTGKKGRFSQGSWELDHIMPCADFKNIATSQEEQKRINHWSNLRPLDWQTNASEKASVPEGFSWDDDKGRYVWDEVRVAEGMVNYELPEPEEKDEDDECKKPPAKKAKTKKYDSSDSDSDDFMGDDSDSEDEMASAPVPARARSGRAVAAKKVVYADSGSESGFDDEEDSEF